MTPAVTVQECQLISRDERGSVVYRAQFALSRRLPLQGDATDTVDPLNIELGGRFLGLLNRDRADIYERRHRGLDADAEIDHQFYAMDNSTETRGINGPLFGDTYRVYGQLSPLAGNYCIRLEKINGTLKLVPINHNARNGGIHGEHLIVFFVYLVFSHPIDDWRDCYYMDTGVTVVKEVPISLRASSDKVNEVQLESELFTAGSQPAGNLEPDQNQPLPWIVNEWSIGNPRAAFVQPDMIPEMDHLHEMVDQHDLAMDHGPGFHHVENDMNFQ